MCPMDFDNPFRFVNISNLPILPQFFFGSRRVHIAGANEWARMHVAMTLPGVESF